MLDNGLEKPPIVLYPSSKPTQFYKTKLPLEKYHHILVHFTLSPPKSHAYFFQATSFLLDWVYFHHTDRAISLKQHYFHGIGGIIKITGQVVFENILHLTTR